MRTAEEWLVEFHKTRTGTAQDFFRRIQADALRHAAEVARCDGPGWTGVLKTTSERICSAIYTEAERLEKGPQ